MVIDFTLQVNGVDLANMDPVRQEVAANYTDVEFIKLEVDELMDGMLQVTLHFN